MSRVEGFYQWQTQINRLRRGEIFQSAESKFRLSQAPNSASRHRQPRSTLLFLRRLALPFSTHHLARIWSNKDIGHHAIPPVRFRHSLSAEQAYRPAQAFSKSEKLPYRASRQNRATYHLVTSWAN